MLGNSSLESSMDLGVPISGMETSMLENVLALVFMDSVSTVFPMATVTRVLGMMVQSKAMEWTLSKMAIQIAVNRTLVPSTSLYPR